jgi:hypothetical protein
LLKFLQVATVVGKDTTTVAHVNLFSFVFYSIFSDPFLSPSQLLSSENPELRQAATLCSRSQLRRRFFLLESRSSLSSTVFSKKSMGLGLDFSASFVAAVLVLKVVMGLGFVAAGAAKELVVVLGRRRS